MIDYLTKKTLRVIIDLVYSSFHLNTENANGLSPLSERVLCLRSIKANELILKNKKINIKTMLHMFTTLIITLIM